MSEKPRMVGVMPLGGGMTIGLEDAGFELVGTMEPSPKFVGGTSHRLNRPDVPASTNEEEWDEWAEMFREEEIELVYGSPPCQGLTGASAHSSVDNPKNMYMIKFARTALKIRPQYAIFENIPRLLSMGKTILNEIEEMARAEGYHVTVHHHNAADFGACQKRKRVMIALERDGKEVVWPSHPRLPWPTVREAISDLEGGTVVKGGFAARYPRKPQTEYQERMRRLNLDRVSNHKRLALPERYQEMPEGIQWTAMPSEWMTEKEIARIQDGRIFNAVELHRLVYDEIAGVFTGAPNKMHPKECRILSVREGARLMGFPDEWEWATDKDYQQVAAGVCPPVCEWFGRVLMAAMDAGPMPVPEGRLI